MPALCVTHLDYSSLTIVGIMRELEECSINRLFVYLLMATGDDYYHVSVQVCHVKDKVMHQRLLYKIIGALDQAPFVTQPHICGICIYIHTAHIIMHVCMSLRFFTYLKLPMHCTTLADQSRSQH